MIGQAGLTLQPYKDTEVLEIGYLLKDKFGIVVMQEKQLWAAKNVLLRN